MRLSRFANFLRFIEKWRLLIESIRVYFVVVVVYPRTCIEIVRISFEYSTVSFKITHFSP